MFGGEFKPPRINKLVVLSFKISKLFKFEVEGKVFNFKF
jgi:hypothetical protein